MVKLNSKKIDGLVSIIRDTKQPLSKRENALAELEKVTNASVKQSEQQFKASLNNFERQWSQFEQIQQRMDEALDSIANSGVDQTEVDKLMQQTQDLVYLERRTRAVEMQHIDSSVDADLERRLKQLRSYVATLPSRSTTPTVDKPPKRETRKNPSGGVLPQFIEDLDVTISDTEFTIEALEEELSQLHEEDDLQQLDKPEFIMGSMTKEWIDSDHENDFEKEEPSPRQKERSQHFSESPVPSANDTTKKDLASPAGTSATQSSAKTGLLDAFINHVKDFLSGVGKLLFGEPISLAEAREKLSDAKEKLTVAEERLDMARNKVVGAAQDLISIQKGMPEKLVKIQEAGKDIEVKQRALVKLRAKTDLPQPKKDEAIHRLQDKINALRNEREALLKGLHGLERRLDSATKTANKASDGVCNATKMHKIALKTVNAANEVVKKALNREDKSMTKERQSSMKNKLQKGRESYSADSEKASSNEAKKSFSVKVR